MPRFHLRRGASFSCVATAVEVAPFSSTACVLRQGVNLTMAGQGAQEGAKKINLQSKEKKKKKEQKKRLGRRTICSGPRLGYRARVSRGTFSPHTQGCNWISNHGRALGSGWWGGAIRTGDGRVGCPCPCQGGQSRHVVGLLRGKGALEKARKAKRWGIAAGVGRGGTMTHQQTSCDARSAGLAPPIGCRRAHRLRSIQPPASRVPPSRPA